VFAAVVVPAMDVAVPAVKVAVRAVVAVPAVAQISEALEACWRVVVRWQRPGRHCFR
jgi:hypothetical protein